MCKMVIVFVAIGHLSLEVHSILIASLAKIKVVAVLAHPTVFLYSLIAAKTFKFLLNWSSIWVKYGLNLMLRSMVPHVGWFSLVIPLEETLLAEIVVPTHLTCKTYSYDGFLEAGTTLEIMNVETMSEYGHLHNINTVIFRMECHLAWQVEIKTI